MKHYHSISSYRLMLCCLLTLLLLVGCGSSQAANNEPIEPVVGTTREEPIAQANAMPTASPTPSSTATSEPSSTSSPVPTATATAPATYTETPLPSAMPTDVPSATATEAPTATVVPASPTVAPTEVVETVVAEATRPPIVQLEMHHTYQRRNNCAPATTSMVVGVHGLYKDQFEIAAIQKPVPDDVNVTAEEVAVSIRILGMGAYVGINGDIDLLERLLAAGFAVMTEEWMPYEEGGVGHFRAIRGYDQTDQTIYYNDSFYGGELWRSHKSILRDWAAFNNKFIVPYPPEREAELQQLIGENWDEATMYENLRLAMQQRVNQEPADSYAWWGLGEALLWQGQPQEAITAFEQALGNESLPAHYLWYRYGYFDALNRVGRHEEVLTLTLQPLNEMGRSEDLRYHRAVAMNGLGRIEEARAELQQALLDNPDFVPAKVLLEQLKG